MLPDLWHNIVSDLAEVLKKRGAIYPSAYFALQTCYLNLRPGGQALPTQGVRRRKARVYTGTRQEQGQSRFKAQAG